MRLNLVGRFLARASSAGIVAAFLGLILAVPARATPIQIQSLNSASTSGLGSFTGSLSYSYMMGAGVITISLTNTSPVANGGAITAFLFNIDSADPTADATMVSSTNANFHNLNNGNGLPFGNQFDAGAGITTFQSNGGLPAQGIAVGQTATFAFSVAASDAASLTSEDFINGPYAYNFIVRFRGFVSGGEDKVPAGIAVPGPSVLTAMAIGLIIIPRRRRPSGRA